MSPVVIVSVIKNNVYFCRLFTFGVVEIRDFQGKSEIKKAGQSRFLNIMYSPAMQ